MFTALAGYGTKTTKSSAIGKSNLWKTVQKSLSAQSEKETNFEFLVTHLITALYKINLTKQKNCISSYMSIYHIYHSVRCTGTLSVSNR